MKIKKIFIYTLLLFLTTLLQSIVAQERIIPQKPQIRSLTIDFNKEPLAGYYILIDTRTEQEKKEALGKKSLAGPVIVFFHGHAQRPDNGFKLTSDLALKSKSGIVIVPMCDTPYGEDNHYRGDNGKDIILMEMTRFILQYLNLEVKNYHPISNKSCLINGINPANFKGSIPVNLLSLGYSHGAIIARRIASIYSNSVISLAQMAPAGYEDWGPSCLAPSCLTANFTGESMCISTEFFRGHAYDTFDLTWGITKGLVGDTFRSCSSCLGGNFTLFKLFRGWKDIKDCTLLMNDKNFPVPNAKHVVVIFARDDLAFEYDNIGFNNPESPQQKNLENFWSTYYPSAVINKAKLTLKILPGQHSGPINYHNQYIKAILEGTEQAKE